MLTGWRLTVSKLFLIPHRYVLGIMGFLAVFNAYTMRVSLNIAITAMVPHVNTTEYPDPYGCNPNDTLLYNEKSSEYGNAYDWDSTIQGLILSSFYWGYLITHIPGGILAEKFGGKYTLSLGILSTAIFTLITPAVIYTSNGNWKVLVILRMVEGLGEGTTYPALNALLARWIPLQERAKMGSLVYAGSQIGTVVSNLVGGYLIEGTEDWSSVFYLFGGLGVLWFLLFTVICYSTPDEHPFISEEEKSFLKKELDNVSSDNPPVPWKAIMTSVPVWALIFAQIGHDWGFYTMVTDLPTYFKDVLKFNIAENGVWSSVPYIVMWTVSMLSGYLCDLCVTKKYMSVTFSRKFFTSIAKMGPAVFIIIASYSGCDRMTAVIMFTIGLGFMGSYYCGMKVNGLDLSPNFAGTLMGIVNGIGAITGIMAPYIAGALTTSHTLLEWRTVFWITFGIFMFTNIVYIIFGSGEEQSWNRTVNDQDPENTQNNTNNVPMKSTERTN